MQLDEAKIAQLKAQYGDSLRTFTYSAAPDVLLVLRCPNRHEHGRWLDKRNEPGKTAEAARELAQACCVFPDAGALASLLEKYPFVLTRRDGIVDTLIDMAGAEGETIVKKL